MVTQFNRTVSAILYVCYELSKLLYAGLKIKPIKLFFLGFLLETVAYKITLKANRCIYT